MFVFFLLFITIISWSQDVCNSTRQTPTDPSWGNQWDRRRIFCPSAWNTRTDGSSIIVAVVSSGVKYDHEDLSANMWQDTDNSYGVSFLNGDGTQTNTDPMDVDGKGTECAGVIGAAGDTAAGIAGICWTAKIMAVRVANNARDVAAGINYAVTKGAKVIMISYTTNVTNKNLEDAIKNAGTQNRIVVAAAGDNGSSGVYFPPSYSVYEMIAVGATDEYDLKTSTTNYGKGTIDLAAPGKNVYTTTVDGAYATKSGTHIAAAQVAGAVALVWSEYPNLKNTSVVNHIYNTVDKLEPLAPHFVKGGRLNVSTAITSPCVIAGFGTTATLPATEKGVQIYRYGDELSPSRVYANNISAKRSSDNGGVRMPSFSKVLVSNKSGDSLSSSEENGSNQEMDVAGESRGIAWDQLNTLSVKAVAMVDLDNDSYPEALYSTGSSVVVFDIPNRKQIATFACAGVNKILPVNWKDTDETGTVYKDVVMSGTGGIWIGRLKPTLVLTKIYTGVNVLDAGYIRQSDMRSYPVRIIFSVASKGMFEYLISVSRGGSLWQIHSLNATSIAPMRRTITKDRPDVIDVVAAFPGYGIYRYDAEEDNGTWHFEDTAYPTILATANVDGTGEDELLAYFPYDGGLYARFGNDWTAVIVNKPLSMSVTDINRDGKEELAVGFETPMKHVVILEYFPNGGTDPYWSTYGLANKSFEALFGRLTPTNSDKK